MDLFVVDTAGITDQPTQSKLVYSVENEGIKNEKTPSKAKSSKESESKDLVSKKVEEDDKYEHYFGKYLIFSLRNLHILKNYLNFHRLIAKC